jgi:hypothetical protein
MYERTHAQYVCVYAYTKCPVCFQYPIADQRENTHKNLVSIIVRHIWWDKR